MTVIQQNDLIESIAGALQYISYYHPADYIQHRRAPMSVSKALPPRTRWRRS